MSLLTGFTIIVVFITIVLSVYTLRSLKDPLVVDKLTSNDKKGVKINFWVNAELTNGRLAMIGFFVLVVNYGFFGWIIPGLI